MGTAELGNNNRKWQPGLLKRLDGQKMAGEGRSWEGLSRFDDGPEQVVAGTRGPSHPPPLSLPTCNPLHGANAVRAPREAGEDHLELRERQERGVRARFRTPGAAVEGTGEDLEHGGRLL